MDRRTNWQTNTPTVGLIVNTDFTQGTVVFDSGKGVKSGLSWSNVENLQTYDQKAESYYDQPYEESFNPFIQAYNAGNNSNISNGMTNSQNNSSFWKNWLGITLFTGLILVRSLMGWVWQDYLLHTKEVSSGKKYSLINIHIQQIYNQGNFTEHYSQY